MEKWDNSKEKVAMGEFARENLQGTNPKGHFQIPKRKLLLDNFNGNSKGTIPKPNFQLETSNGRILMGQFQRETIRGKFQRETSNCPQGDFQWANSNAKIPKGNFQRNAYKKAGLYCRRPAPALHAISHHLAQAPFLCIVATAVCQAAIQKPCCYAQ